MFGLLSRRIFTLLQLTRMALVFTAISNGACEVLLSMSARSGTGWTVLKPLAAMSAVSVGLYGFGMTLNDIIDRRRDSRIAAHRPLPSGRIRPTTAHVVCVLLLLLAAAGAAAYSRWVPPAGRRSLLLAGITVAVILFYDIAGKYLVALGLISLGVIRFLQASVAAPLLPVVWHPLLLFNHVVILSTICYHWEEKRPLLTPKHWWTVGGGVLGLNVLLVTLLALRRTDHRLPEIVAVLGIGRGLIPPLIAAAAFVGIAFLVRRQNPSGRDAGQKLMLYGLLWLIVYDAAFVLGFVSVAAAAALICLLPIAWWSVRLMRWWSNLISLSQRPVYQRARA
jgi:hypothetical protein